MRKVTLDLDEKALEERLADIEAGPAFRASMSRALKEIAEGKVVSQAEVERRLRPRRRR